MAKRSLRFILPVTLLLVLGSVASADTYSIDSTWTIGTASPVTYTGAGSFTWDGLGGAGSDFSNIVFSFTSTIPNDPNDWNTSTLPPGATPDGELFSGDTDLIIGNSGNDCGGTSPGPNSCVNITFGSAITTGVPLVLQGTLGVSQTPNSYFVSATLTDTTTTAEDTSTVPEPSAVILLLTVLVATGLVVGKIRRRVSPALGS